MALKWWRTITENPAYQDEKENVSLTLPSPTRIGCLSSIMILLICIFISSISFSNEGGFRYIAVFWEWVIAMLVPIFVAPTIGNEVERGTWDSLRLLPQPLWLTLLAKMFGALSALKVWWGLALLNLFQVMIMLTDHSSTIFGSFFWLLRPWLGIVCIALTSIVSATLTRSGPIALALTYCIVMPATVIITFFPFYRPIGYALAIIFLLIVLWWRAIWLEAGKTKMSEKVVS